MSLPRLPKVSTSTRRYFVRRSHHDLSQRLARAAKLVDINPIWPLCNLPRSTTRQLTSSPLRSKHLARRLLIRL